LLYIKRQKLGLNSASSKSHDDDAATMQINYKSHLDCRLLFILFLSMPFFSLFLLDFDIHPPKKALISISTFVRVSLNISLIPSLFIFLIIIIISTSVFSSSFFIYLFIYFHFNICFGVSFKKKKNGLRGRRGKKENFGKSRGGREIVG
jgi:hypothetical protein